MNRSEWQAIFRALLTELTFGISSLSAGASLMGRQVAPSQVVASGLGAPWERCGGPGPGLHTPGPAQDLSSPASACEHGHTGGLLWLGLF